MLDRTHSTIAIRLLRWFKKAARDLPWRHSTDPYAIWVSEIMLQQTQVKTVLPYWQRWMHALPTLSDLAKVDSPTLHKLWEGLGYYTRVRNMQSAAQHIEEHHQGKFPASHPEVLALPGIGPYTAGAICSIAFNQPTPILDGNVSRVLSRLFGISGDPTKTQTRQRLWQLAEDVLRAAEPLARRRRTERVYGELNQALMELGALVCLPGEPRCSECPLRACCFAFKTNRVREFPTPRLRPATTLKRVLAFALSKRTRYLVRQRPAGTVNAHLWEFPNVETKETDPLSAAKAAGLQPTRLTPLTKIVHSITRYRITLEVYAGADGQSQLAGGKWCTLAELQRLPFSSAHKRIIAKLSAK